MDTLDDEDLNEMGTNSFLSCKSHFQTQKFDSDEEFEDLLKKYELESFSGRTHLQEEDPVKACLPREVDNDQAEAELLNDNSPQANPTEIACIIDDLNKEKLDDFSEATIFNNDPDKITLFSADKKQNTLVCANSAKEEVDNEDSADTKLLKAQFPEIDILHINPDGGSSDLQHHSIDFNEIHMEEDGEKVLYDALEDELNCSGEEQLYSKGDPLEVSMEEVIIDAASSPCSSSPCNSEEKTKASMAQLTDESQTGLNDIPQSRWDKISSKENLGDSQNVQSIMRNSQANDFGDCSSSTNSSQSSSGITESTHFNLNSKNSVSSTPLPFQKFKNANLTEFLSTTQVSNEIINNLQSDSRKMTCSTSENSIDPQEYLATKMNKEEATQKINVVQIENPSGSDLKSNKPEIFLDEGQKNEWHDFLREVEDYSRKGVCSSEASFMSSSLNFFNECSYRLSELQERFGILTLKDKPKEGKLKWYKEQLCSRDELITEMNSFIINLILQGKEVENKLNHAMENSSSSTTQDYLLPVTNSTNKTQASNGMKKQENDEQSEASSMECYGYIYVEEAGMYYDHSSRHYFDPKTQLYFDVDTRTYFYYDPKTEEYKFHSSVDDDTATGVLQSTFLKEEENASSIDEASRRDCISKEEEIGAKVSAWSIAPCLRIMVAEDDNPKTRFHMITIDGGCIGRDKKNAIHLDHESVDEIHAEIVYKTNGIDDHHYFVRDLGSTNGTWVNGKRLNSERQPSEEVEIGHDWDLKCGEIIMKCHIHPGNLTCTKCDIGFASSQLSVLSSSKTSQVEAERRRQVKLLRKKYSLSFHEDSAFLAKEISQYRNRAKERRKAKGSTNPHEKTEVASVNCEMSKKNKGFKMLKQMGWSEGQSLGLSKNGRTEPVLAEGNVGYAGLGSNQTAYILKKPTDKQLEKKRIMSLTKLRYDQAAPFLEENSFKKTKNRGSRKQTSENS